MTTPQANDSVYFFTLNKPYYQCKPLYTGEVPTAILLSDGGQRVQVPVVTLRRFIDSRGLVGRFRLVVSPQNKIKSFERIC